MGMGIRSGYRNSPLFRDKPGNGIDRTDYLPGGILVCNPETIRSLNGHDDFDGIY
jgi:hypothetical protein